MSGPKSSRYTLTAEQRRILDEQRQIEQKKSALLESISGNRNHLSHTCALFSEAKRYAADLANRAGNDGGFTDRLSELESLLALVDSTVSKTNNNEISSLESTAKTVSTSLARAEKIAAELSVISAKNETTLRSLLNEDIDKAFGESFAVAKPADEVSQLKSAAIERIIELKNASNLPVELVDELNEALVKIDSIEDKEFWKNFSSITLTTLFKRCQEFLRDYDECHEEFEALYAEYNSLCKMYSYVARSFTRCSASVDALRSEIKRIQEAAAESDEQAYICACLDEVMDEMGYSVVGHREVSKRDGTHFRNELYTYEDGTAVNVTYSSDGRIAMELGGVDTIDRLPDAQEAIDLCEAMERFCENFKEIEKRLLAKGVILAERIALLPPDVDYAQIINTTDYCITNSAEMTSVKQRKKNIRTGIKHLSRKED